MIASQYISVAYKTEMRELERESEREMSETHEGESLERNYNNF